MQINNLAKQDSELAGYLNGELTRQQQGLTMIPSENYVSEAVLEAGGSVLTNKYAEGYPFKRYYTGNEFVDKVEQLAIDRAKQLFGAEHANVQPHAGSTANMEAYAALLEPGDKIMSMNLSQGGHLTHGSPVNFSGKTYQFISYNVDKETEMIDLEQVRALAHQEKPKLILSGFTAYPRKIAFSKFAEIAKEVGAIAMADISHIAGLCATGVHESPVVTHDVVTTTTHKTLRGPRAALIMCKAQYAKAIDKSVFPGHQGGPLEHVIAAKAAAFQEAMQPDFKIYAEQIVKNAQALAKVFLANGLRLVSGGTDTHLILIDCTNLGITGKVAANALEECLIYTNFNMIPFDPRTPFDPSGLRLGTPALTTRGMQETEMELVGNLILQVLKHSADEKVKQMVKAQVLALTEKFPIYGN